MENNILGLEEIEVENTAIDSLDSEVVNLIFTGIDGSGSMWDYKDDMKTSLKGFKESIKNSKEADTILVARGDFSDDEVTIGGYKKIEEFDTDYDCDGRTPLYDTIVEATDKLIEYMDFLKDQGMRVKAVFSIFSDGNDLGSRKDFSDARDKIKLLNKREIVTACIGFGGEAIDEAQKLGFKNILKVGSSASELRKAFNCLSKSVAENSKSVVNKVDDFFEV